MRLIDANALHDTILRDRKLDGKDVNWAVNRIISHILNAPTVEERPKGKWIRTGSLGNGNAQYTCSNCSYGDEHAESQEVPYCWHCGADMRGDV